MYYSIKNSASSKLGEFPIKVAIMAEWIILTLHSRPLLKSFWETRTWAK